MYIKVCCRKREEESGKHGNIIIYVIFVMVPNGVRFPGIGGRASNKQGVPMIIEALLLICEVKYEHVFLVFICISFRLFKDFSKCYTVIIR